MDINEQNSCCGKKVERLENKQFSQDINVYHFSSFWLSLNVRCLATKFC